MKKRLGIKMTATSKHVLSHLSSIKHDLHAFQCKLKTVGLHSMDSKHHHLEHQQKSNLQGTGTIRPLKKEASKCSNPVCLVALQRSHSSQETKGSTSQPPSTKIWHLCCCLHQCWATLQSTLLQLRTKNIGIKLLLIKFAWCLSKKLQHLH